MITIELNNETDFKVKKSFIEKLLNNAANIINKNLDTLISVAIIEDDEMKKINKKYSGINKSTDVLSFADNEIGKEENKGFKREGDFLGEILIAKDVLLKYAKEHDNSNEKELAILITHGFLHLLGYDHCSEEEKSKMKGLEMQILDKIKTYV